MTQIIAGVENDKVAAFLTELSALSLKYGIEIGGCGCCGSPWLRSIQDSTADRYEYQETGQLMFEGETERTDRAALDRAIKEATRD